MKIGAGGPQIQTMEEFKLGNGKAAELKELEKHPELVEAKNNEGKNVTASWDKVVQAVDELNKFSTLSNTHIVFEVDGGIQDLRVKIINEEGEIIRIIPPEQALEMLHKFQTSIGAILDCYI